MGPSKYGRYLHILTLVGADGAHGESQQWDGITGRVKHLVKQDNDRLMGVVERNNALRDEMDERLGNKIKDVDTKVDEMAKKIKDVDKKMEKMEKMDAKLGKILDLLSSTDP